MPKVSKRIAHHVQRFSDYETIDTLNNCMKKLDNDQVAAGYILMNRLLIGTFY